MKIARVVSLGILVLVFILVLTSVVNPGSMVATERTLDEPVSTPLPTLSPCVAFDKKSGKKNVVIRVSDVQSYAWRATISTMIEEANQSSIPLVLSTIPYQIEEDKELVSLIKQNACNLEVAQQGTRHSDKPELQGLTQEETKNVALEGKSVLESVLGIQIKTYVPHKNWFNWKSLLGLKDAGYDTVSVEGNIENYTGVTTYSFARGKLVDNKSVVQSCKNAFANGKTCVVIVYPGYYPAEKYHLYAELIESLKSLSGVTFTTFKK